MHPFLTRSTLMLLLLFGVMFSLCGAASPVQQNTNSIAGTLYGREFKPETVELENGQLTFRQGEAFSPKLRLSIALFDLGRGEIPSGKVYAVYAGNRSNANISISTEWSNEAGEPVYTFNIEGYSLKISFGKEEIKGLLPGMIEFSRPGTSKTVLVGAFVAKVKGLRFINGKVDLTSDAHAVLDEVAVEYLRKKHLGKEVKIAEQRDSMLVTTAAQRKWGYKDLSVTAAGKPVGRVKLLFTKQSGEWAIFSELQPEQFPQAHPVHPPDENEYEEMVTFVSARKGEEEFLKAFPGKGVYGVNVTCSYYDPDNGFVGASLKYRVEGSDAEHERQFVLRRNDRRWEIIRELDGNARIDQEVTLAIMEQKLGKPCDSCRVTGTLIFDGKDIAAATPVQPKFWFRNEQKNIEVIPQVDYQNGRFTMVGLPPGDYGMSVDIDANPANPITYPGDYQIFTRFTVTEGENRLPDVAMMKVMHLTAPQDNGGTMAQLGEECSDNVSHPSPVVFAWEPLGEEVSYDYQVNRVDCKTYQTLATMDKGTTAKSSLSMPLPKSKPGEFYMFMIYARKNDHFIGMLTTHGDNGYGWDYRFRAR